MSILVAIGEDPASVMAQLGHSDPKFTLRVYSHAKRRTPEEQAQLRALVDGPDDVEHESGAAKGAAVLDRQVG